MRFAIFLLLSALSIAAAEAPRPNVVLIFIDDMGYGDVGFNGATGPKTPNIDKLAAEGMRFDDFYVGCAVCSGSRTALMTGTHYRRLGMAPVLFPNSKEGLDPAEVTIADMLKTVGYKTACIGKWHLGHLPPCLPTYQGFDTYFGIPYSNDMWRDPANKVAANVVLREGVTPADMKAGHTKKNWVPLMRGEEIVEYPADQNTLTRRYTEEAIKIINANKAEPFFIYLPHTMVHQPLAVSEPFAKLDRPMIHNAIEEVDWSVGEIMKAIKDNNIDDKTLVIFTSDNGAALGSSLPLRGKKAQVYDGGIREPTAMRWPGHIPAGTVCHEVTASIDILPTLAGLTAAKLPARPIDGMDIWPLMSGAPDAKSPHDVYCLDHGPGTVRAGKWKFYPWQERTGGKKDSKPIAGAPKVQLYDTVADIGETKNVAEAHPEIIARLQQAWDAHVADIKATIRPPVVMSRPDNAPASTRPTR